MAYNRHSPPNTTGITVIGSSLLLLIERGVPHPSLSPHLHSLTTVSSEQGLNQILCFGYGGSVTGWGLLGVTPTWLVEQLEEGLKGSRYCQGHLSDSFGGSVRACALHLGTSEKPPRAITDHLGPVNTPL